MYELTKIPSCVEDNIIPACDLKVGELGEIVGLSYEGILLRTFEGIVSLTAPNHTWDKDCTLDVKKLTRGTIVQLKVTS
ncbi:hypothetical protein LCGC14_2249090 [marine sediment metagenome]|uniref:Uncharacterized protein n=1 Tax=marine sediment metagenome TaxID=412755 RepID=A0A0F9DQK7_9ZZZZ